MRSDPLRDAAQCHPDATAVIHAGGALTFCELDMRVEEQAQQLEAPGYLLINRPADLAVLETILAGFRAGMTVCPLNLRHPPATHARQQALLDACMPLDADDKLILFTSGSTAEPKGVRLSLEALIANAAGSNTSIPLGPGDTWLLSLPLYHVAGIGILLRCLLGGAAVTLPGDRSLASALASVSHVSLVPTQLQRLLEADIDLSHLRCILLGGAPAAPSLIARCVALGLPLRTTWGMTETASQVTTTSGSAGDELASSGVLLPGRELRISKAEEIEVRGPIMFRGYLGQRPRAPDAWFATGDRGRFDDDGRLHVLGRTDLQFVCGGENIQPEPIEAALMSLPDISQALVVPLADSELGHRPLAFIRAEQWQPAIWVAALRDRLPGYMIPRVFALWPEEISGQMKVNRAEFLRIVPESDLLYL